MANQSANQPTGTIINSNKQVNMYNNQQNATIHKDNSKDFFGLWLHIYNNNKKINYILFDSYVSVNHTGPFQNIDVTDSLNWTSDSISQANSIKYEAYLTLSLDLVSP